MNLIPKIERLSFDTSHFQFYLVDPEIDFDTGAPSFWSKEAHERGLAVGPSVLAIGTTSYGHVRCFFEVAEREPQFVPTPWDRIIEASITLSTGRYQIQNCDEAKTIFEGEVSPGDYRLRIYGAFLDEDTDGNDETFFDFYWLVLWPQEFSDVKVLKNAAWNSSSEG
jgi:hypothetical protein